jgi:hypothetical protein
MRPATLVRLIPLCAILLSACTTHRPTPQATVTATTAAQTTDPNYDTVKTVLAIPPCTARLGQRSMFEGHFTSTDGRHFTIGSPEGDQEVWHFIYTVREGQSCDFPGEFQRFEARKFYPTAEAIRAMPPCKATIVTVGPCFSVFRASDGQMFVIGDPGSKNVVHSFLQLLEEDSTYELPDAFLEFQSTYREEKDEG